MKKGLNNLLKVLPRGQVHGNKAITVTGIEYDSRNVSPGNVFVAINGYREDGNTYINQAVSKGAGVIVSSVKPKRIKDYTLVLVDNPRLALAALSGEYYNHPSGKLNVIGVTGTNGKTTVSYLLESILNARGGKAGLFGTVEYRTGKKSIPALTTTPESRDLQRMLAELLANGFDSAVIEVSSHALVQDRVEEIEFDAAVFTNLTRDHLDFHENMDDYLNAKIKLFSGLGMSAGKKREKVAVINNDDPASGKVKGAVKKRIITYALENAADITASDIRLGLNKTSFVLQNGMDGLSVKISLPLPGRFNLYNALAAAATGIGQQIPLEDIKKGIEGVRHIPGRFEVIDEGQSFTVIVDYAHTDDSLRRILKSCRQLSPERIITVFGCGGDRDRGKRPLMGEAAVKYSDYVVVTSDNPRTEEPDKIILDIETGIKKTGRDNYQLTPDRREAIEQAVGMADKRDMVVIAGKGHEDYQVLGNTRIHFDDREVAREALKRLKTNGKNNNK